MHKATQMRAAASTADAYNVAASACSGAGSDCSSSSSRKGSDGDFAVRVPRRIRNRLALDHSARVKELEKQMLPKVFKGPRSQRDDAKAAFEARYSVLQAQLADRLQEAIASSSLPPTAVAVDESAHPPDHLPPRRQQVESEKRERLSKKRADYMCRRIYRELSAHISAGDLQCPKVTKMIENSRANLELPVENGRSLLLVAAHADAAAVVVSLLRSGARPDAKDEEQRTALVIAASRNNSCIFDVLLDCIKSDNRARVSPEEAQRCMRFAVSLGSTRVALSLLRHIQARKWFARFVDWSLIAAAAAASADVLQLLLQQGANCNAADGLKRSALMHAVASKVSCTNGETTQSHSHCACRRTVLIAARGCCCAAAPAQLRATPSAVLCS